MASHRSVVALSARAGISFSPLVDRLPLSTPWMKPPTDRLLKAPTKVEYLFFFGLSTVTVGRLEPSRRSASAKPR